MYQPYNQSVFIFTTDSIRTRNNEKLGVGKHSLTTITGKHCGKEINPKSHYVTKNTDRSIFVQLETRRARPQQLNRERWVLGNKKKILSSIRIFRLKFRGNDDKLRFEAKVELFPFWIASSESKIDHSENVYQYPERLGILGGTRADFLTRICRKPAFPGPLTFSLIYQESLECSILRAGERYLRYYCGFIAPIFARAQTTRTQQRSV